MYADLKTQEWVFGADLTAPAKLVLFALIYHANKDTGLAFPSQETIAAKTSLTRPTVCKALKALEAKGLIVRVKSAGRSVTYRLDCIRMAPQRPKNLQTSFAADANELDSSCKRDYQQLSTRLTAAVKEVYTNQSIKPKHSTNPPTKEENRPPAIQPTVFKQSDVGAGEDNVVDGERDWMFEEFWAAYPERCPRKVDKARCRQLYAGLAAAAPDASSFHARALSALKRWDMSEMWNKEGGKYICAPCRWLERRSWEDAPAPDKAVVTKKAAANRTYDWSLCAERCANCAGNRCGVGIKVPPNLDEWPSPPEECKHFHAAS